MTWNNEQEHILNELRRRVEGRDAEDVLRIANDLLSGSITLASSLSEEDQVLTDMAARAAPKVSVFILDTGRLHPETYDLLERTQKRYDLNFRIFFPRREDVEKMVQEKGINLFYESIENRKLCCNIRKVEPLRRALTGQAAWVTGIRRGQSITRAQTPTVERDETHNLIKLNPLASWSRQDVLDYIREHNIDTNVLHKSGYASIGCAPCTRPVQPGEDVRAGRWWWEKPEQKECGLHVRKEHGQNKSAGSDQQTR